MKLNEVLSKVKSADIIGDGNVDITGVNIDSRRIQPGHLFVAVRGTQVDGHSFIPKAIEQGAVAVLCEDVPAVQTEGVTFVKVASTEAAVGPVATMFYGDPSTKLQLVGVTGTNGKTTIATLLYNMFRKFGHKCGLLSTVCNYIEDEAIPADHTTPDPIELNRLLAKMVEAGCEYAFMECSSHAIAQKRIGGLKFAGGLFTNLTRDHLDYHKTFENYRDAKKAFFDSLPKTAFAITNADDKNGMVMVQNTKATVKTYSTRSMADFKAKIIECHFEGMYLDIDGHEVGVNFIGKFNVSNLLAVYGAAVMLGKKPEDVLVVMSTLHSVNGRLDPIQTPWGFTAVIDYAHTPDALENVLKTLRDIDNGKELICLFGCGGDRDKTKRPEMAAIAEKYADRIVVTSDNSRTERTEDIMDDIRKGFSVNGLAKAIFISDRKEAIRASIMFAKDGGVILLAGKGHETYQIIGTEHRHFDEREVVSEIFNSLTATKKEDKR